MAFSESSPVTRPLPCSAPAQGWPLTQLRSDATPRGFCDPPPASPRQELCAPNSWNRNCHKITLKARAAPCYRTSVVKGADICWTQSKHLFLKLVHPCVLCPSSHTCTPDHRATKHLRPRHMTLCTLLSLLHHLRPLGPVPHDTSLCLTALASQRWRPRQAGQLRPPRP